MMEYIIKAIPFFVLFIAIELLVAFIQKKSLYEFKDSASNISCGLMQVTINYLFKPVMAAGYLFIYEYVAPYHLSHSLFVWVFTMIAVDLCYYIFHRVSHRVSFFWALHVVHHQSEYFNLSVAVRQSGFGGFFSWIFYIPLAFLGVPPEIMALSLVINLLYQFWIHTSVIQKCGPLELIFNTPSHHRVHHGRNMQYLDKNYAGILIIWDKLFGTFEPEREKPDYGITVPLKSANPLWANFHVWVELLQETRLVKGIKNKIYVFYKPPGTALPISRQK